MLIFCPPVGRSRPGEGITPMASATPHNVASAPVHLRIKGAFIRLQSDFPRASAAWGIKRQMSIPNEFTQKHSGTEEANRPRSVPDQPCHKPDPRPALNPFVPRGGPPRGPKTRRPARIHRPCLCMGGAVHSPCSTRSGGRCYRKSTKSEVCRQKSEVQGPESTV